MPGTIRPMHLKHVLRDVQTDRGSLLHGRLLRWQFDTVTLARRCRRGASTPSPGEAIRGSVETIERPRPRANGSSRPKAVARAVPRWRWYNFLPDRAAGCEETEPFDGRENRSATSLWRLHIPTVERERFDPLCGSRPPSTRLGSDRQRDKAWFRAVYSRRAYSGEGRGIGGPPGQPHTLSRSR